VNAVLLLSAAHNAVAASSCYGWFYSTSQTGYLLGCIGSAFFACFGLCVLMFAGDKAMISKNHHFDQATSSWPFKNAESYKTKKKAL
jgi:hypothetical protein